MRIIVKSLLKPLLSYIRRVCVCTGGSFYCFYLFYDTNTGKSLKIYCGVFINTYFIKPRRRNKLAELLNGKTRIMKRGCNSQIYAKIQTLPCKYVLIEVLLLRVNQLLTTLTITLTMVRHALTHRADREALHNLVFSIKSSTRTRNLCNLCIT